MLLLSHVDILALCVVEQPPLYKSALPNVISVDSFFVGLTTTVLLATRGHGNVRLTPTRLPAPPITRTCLLRPCSRIAPSAQPVEAPAPRPRSGIACLRLWPELTVATGSSRSFFVHTAPGYLCTCRHSQAVKPLWFGRTLAQYLVTLPRTKRRAELLAPCWYFFPCLTAGVVRAGAPVLVRLRPLPFLRSSVVEEDK